MIRPPHRTEGVALFVPELKQERGRPTLADVADPTRCFQLAQPPQRLSMVEPAAWSLTRCLTGRGSTG